jgi:GGDEF domain-containing protein
LLVTKGQCLAEAPEFADIDFSTLLVFVSRALRGHMEATPRLSPDEQLSSLCGPFKALLGAHMDAAALYAPDGSLLALNAAAEHLRKTIYFRDLQEGTLARDAFAMVATGRIAAYEAHVRSGEGTMYLRVDLTPVMDDDVLLGVLEVVHEPRVAVSREDGIDPITGLPSSAILYDRISRLIFQLRRDSRPFALHLFSVAAEDADDDSLIMEVRRVTAGRLSSSLRRVDTVARLGRAFVVVQPDVADLNSTKRLLERLVDELREPVPWQGRLHVPNVRVGSALATRNTTSVEELFVEADLALARVRGSRILESEPLVGRRDAQGYQS